MRVMGQDPMPVKEFREYLRVVRTMLKGENVDYTYRDRTTEIAWQHHGGGFRNTFDPIPIYVAANGPLALRAAGAYGDGLISIFNEQADVMKANLDLCRAGAEKVGRALDDSYHTASLCHAVVLRPGETLRTPRVIEAAGSWVVTALHFVYEVWRYTQDDSVVPGYMKNVWQQYLDRIAKMPLPEEKKHQMLHEGHCSYYPAVERELLTPEMIEGTCIVGGPSEVAEKIRVAGRAGLKEVSLLPPMMHLREIAREFAQQVIPRI